MSEVKNKKVYFASDFHLGVKAKHSSEKREQLILKFLDRVHREKAQLFLLGDIFDFWFEYKKVVPKGHVRFMGKLAQMRDDNIPIEVITGNHDLWMFGYFEKELDIKVHKSSIVREIQGKKIFMAHGDGLGPGDNSFKLIKSVFTSRIAQNIFRLIHPDIGVRFAHWWSRKSRQSHKDDSTYLGDDKEFLFQFAKKTLHENDIDYFIFGHRHLPVFRKINEPRQSVYCNLGDWLSHYTYAILNNGQLVQKKFLEE